MRQKPWKGENLPAQRSSNGHQLQPPERGRARARAHRLDSGQPSRRTRPGSPARIRALPSVQVRMALPFLGRIWLSDGDSAMKTCTNVCAISTALVRGGRRGIVPALLSCALSRPVRSYLVPTSFPKIPVRSIRETVYP